MSNGNCVHGQSDGSPKKDEMVVIVAVGGDQVRTIVPQNTTLQAVFEGEHLRGLQTLAGARVNGKPATPDQPLNPNDEIEVVPTGGKLG